MTTAAIDLAAARRHCQRIARRRARNFYYGLRLSPEPERSALYAVYAWMRRADDLVDDATGDAGAAVESLRAETHAVLDGRASDDPVMIALRDVHDRYDIERSVFDAMLDGQLDDVQERTYANWSELRGYCERVASSVGLACMAVWGCRDETSRQLAVERGVAFQLTNILRDLSEDHARGRCYLPGDELDAAGLTPHELLAWGDAGRCRAFLCTQVARARAHYESSAALESHLAARFRPTLQAMTGIYRAILEQMETDPARLVSGRRLRVSLPRKLAIALRTRLA